MDYQTSFIAYDTICRIQIECDQETEARKLLCRCEELAKQVETTLSMYDANSELNKLCSSYEVGTVYSVSPMLWDFLTQNKYFFEKTEGVFDPTVGPLVKLWNFLDDDPIIPSDTQIQERLQNVGFQHVHLLNGTVSFDKKGVVIDPGASGKGFALQLVSDYLLQHHMQHAQLDFGGNMLFIGGKALPNKQEQPWKIAIVDPNNTSSYIGTVEMENCGIATSSWYEHSFMKDGKVYHHLIDPSTGYPKELTLSSVSVLSSNASFTDFLSTSLFILGEEKATKLADTVHEETGAYIGLVLVRSDGSIVSKNCSFHIK